ncbi:MAG TPA: N-acetylmuramoyl-L-alanine amidase [Jiangellaceae bacterium]|nr:N-acetylmuramoyl-L-alanine amidase [Jiangellaceae bacterium]
MCHACERSLGRRRFLHRALVGTGLAAVAGSVGEVFGVVGAAATPGGDPFENSAIGEDAAFGSMGSVGLSATPGGSTGGLVAPDGLVQVATATSVSAPPIVRRSQWGADETLRANERAYTPIRKLIVHHSASANRPSNPASVVRDMYRYHRARGYSDLGYNFVIDHKGVIYEGRYSRPYASGEQVTGEDGNGWGVVGGHAAKMNAAACGVVLIGDFTDSNPTDAAVASLVWLLSWKAARHRIDAINSDPYISLFGVRMTTPNLAGHRQVGETFCPGRLSNLLPSIRTQVAANAGRWPAITINVPQVVRYELGPDPEVQVRPEPVGSGSAPGVSTGSGGSTTALLPVPLAAGARGPAVSTVQRALAGQGLQVAVDGIFGNQTRTALGRFQSSKGLSATGQADLPTVTALGLVNSARSNVLVLPQRAGASGEPVKAVQRALTSSGLRVVVDGSFGYQTRFAVYRFQVKKGLPATGDVDLSTAAALGVVSISGVTAAPAAASTTAPPTTGAATTAVNLPVVLGMYGDDVRIVQRALREFGYGVKIDGAFGSVTLSAVKRFQRANGLNQTGNVYRGTAVALGLL